MGKNITRRDLLNGMALSLAGATIASKTVLADTITHANRSTIKGNAAGGQQCLPDDYYPPLKNGIRGSHKGSFEVAHDLAWRGNRPRQYEDSGEEYDLVVVGAGISGLAAAYFYQKHSGGNQKILLLDNHDDFGGHAKRNEFHSQGNMLLGFGGSQNLEHSDNYSVVSRELLEELGVDFEKLRQAMDPEFALAKMDKPIGMFLETDTSANIVAGEWFSAGLGFGDYKSLLKKLDLPEDETTRLMSFYGGDKDYLDGLSLTEKLEYIKTTAYNDYLKDKVGLTNQALALFDTFLRANYAVGGDCLSVTEALMSGAPGLRSLGWLGHLGVKLTVDPKNLYEAKYFPDGNASIARLLVRKLIPGVASGNDMFDIATAKFDYKKLDQPDSLVKLRLNSTAVHVQNLSDNQVAVSYVDKSNGKEGGAAQRNITVKAKRCILACYNGIIPHLCPELPESQKENLKYGVKCPLVYVNVLLRDGAVINKAGAKMFNCPDSHYDWVATAPLTAIGDYSAKVVDGQPAVLFMSKTPPPQRDGDNPQQTARDLLRLGRYKLYTTPFSEYEANVRQQLNAMFGPYGFDADRDIEAITVNRWSHGYAYQYMDLFDPEWPAGEAPHELGRKPFGNITIANSDSEAYAYVDGAIDAAWRAVKEQLLK
ncbi:FAD-dependent oxidoreductase [Pseudomaricurvus alkylphenolicus]|uniref:NAD(P)-binding protein n=1 Tax=Pseudomaricurvus alkylphenolicus TaxID=1306991 RepID=UPI00141FF9B8|nr:FAD/NAD(P)-binding protein [Pseudomaricurvus alkylphenolicus]NIB42213.1 FAD-dependent oxidoreductase [Pseudomaricurvus alkylphenolicus]